jgi:hypothetical protein
MAQKFLPSHREWLDYEAVLIERDDFIRSLLTCALVSAPVDTGAFFGDSNRQRHLGGIKNEKVFSF